MPKVSKHIGPEKKDKLKRIMLEMLIGLAIIFC